MSTGNGRRYRVLLVDDDPGLLRLLTLRLKSEGYEVAACENAAQAQSSVPRFRPDAVVTDLRMAEQDGIGLLRDLQRRYPALPVILMTAHGTIPDAVEATRSGAFAFLTKPVDKDQLLEQLQKALKVSGFAAAREDWREDVITRNPIMEDRLAQALQAAGTEAPVLLTGQPGTGKEPMARAIHKASARREQPFASVACPSLSGPDLAALLRESTGTLYLDEIADLDAQTQASLEQLLESGTAGTGPRVISSSARDLSGAIAKGFFREKLYYGLGVVQIDLPPLSQRREDIPLLAAHFLAELDPTGMRHVFAPEAVELLMSAEWPGNGSQLINLVRQAAAVAPGPVISAEVVQQALGGRGGARVPTFDEAREEFTRNYLSQLLQITRGNVTQAAKLAGRNRTDFYKLLGRHEVIPDDFKPF